MRLIFAHHSAIYKVNAEGSLLELVTNTTAASGLDFHYQKNLLFWSDTVTRKVRGKNVVPSIQTIAFNKYYYHVNKHLNSQLLSSLLKFLLLYVY